MVGQGPVLCAVSCLICRLPLVHVLHSFASPTACPNQFKDCRKESCSFSAATWYVPLCSARFPPGSPRKNLPELTEEEPLFLVEAPLTPEVQHGDAIPEAEMKLVDETCPHMQRRTACGRCLGWLVMLVGERHQLLARCSS